MNKLLTTLFTPLTILYFTGSILLIATAGYAENYTVERVIDGDTLKLTNGERVRLIGIDAPEPQPNSKARSDAERTGQDLETINKMGQEATEFVKGFIRPGQKVQLEFDVQERDKYGRLLAYVYHRAGSTKARDLIPEYYETKIVKEYNHTWIYNFLNASIIKAGFATPMTIPPNVKYTELFNELYAEARDSNRGLWDGGYWNNSMEFKSCKNNADCVYINCSTLNTKEKKDWKPWCDHEVCVCGSGFERRDMWKTRKSNMSLWGDDYDSNYYELLKNKCQKHKEENRKECCLKSVAYMKREFYKLPEMKDNYKTAYEGCPEGWARTQLRCLSSYEFCVPYP